MTWNSPGLSNKKSDCWMIPSHGLVEKGFGDFGVVKLHVLSVDPGCRSLFFGVKWLSLVAPTNGRK